MTPTQIKAALEQLGAPPASPVAKQWRAGRPNKSLGQHFLIDKAALGTIVEAADIKPRDRVLEVGPGLGVLTHALLERGAEVVAIEKDRRFTFTPILSPAEQGKGDLRVLWGDAAKLDWDTVMGSRPWKFVSNLPYAITSLALRKALYAKNPPTVVVVLVQREVAERAIMNAKRKTHDVKTKEKTSLLSLMVALASTEAKIIRRVPAGAFYPPPKVESAILKIVPSTSYLVPRTDGWGVEPEDVMALAKKGFAHPRKLLQRNLGIEGSQWQELSKELSFDLKTRAEDLTVGQWAGLAKSITLRSLA